MFKIVGWEKLNVAVFTSCATVKWKYLEMTACVSDMFGFSHLFFDIVRQRVGQLFSPDNLFQQGPIRLKYK